jgi:hypothetical protein
MPIPSHPPPDDGAQHLDDTPWQAALQAGSVEPLLASGIARIIAEAGAGSGNEGIAEVLGTLRVVLARLVTEEQDLDALTRNVSRITSILIRAARVQHQITSQDAASIVDALAVILAEIQPNP